MMLLNLISPQMHETLKQRILLSTVRTFIVVILGVEVAFAAALFVGDYQLSVKAKRLLQEADRSTLLLRSQGQATIADTTKLLNNQVNALQEIQERYVPWAPIFQNFSDLTPTGIALTNIHFNQTTGKVSFRGTASTREAYVHYEQVLQSSTLLKEVVFPLQTKKFDIEFTVTAGYQVPI
jgi:uncharacterized protein YoxC